MAAPKPPVTVTLRVAANHLACCAVDRELTVRAERRAPNPPLAAAPYPALDVHHVWRWLLAVLGDFGETFRIEALVPTAVGGIAVLVDGRQPVLAPMRPEAIPPAAVAAAYAAIAPRPEATGQARDASVRSLGLRLFWQEKAFPEAFARARWILPHAAFWGFRLTAGVAAAEASSLAEGGDLVEIVGTRPSTLARRLGYAQRLPALREPHRLLGRLAPEVIDRAGLAAASPVLVGGTDTATAHALVLAAGYDRAALVLVDEHVVLVPGAATPTADRQVIASLDRRPLTRFPLPADAEALAANLDDLGHAGPVLVAGEWSEATALARERRARDQAVFAFDGTAAWARGAALLAHWGRRPVAPRLAVERVASGD